MLLLAAEVSDTGGRGPIDDFWYNPVPGRGSAAGMNDETAMRVATLYACVSVISQDLAKVPLLMYRRLGDGGRERVTDHPLLSLLRQPTPLLTGVDWRERLEAHQLLRGNGYCHIRTNYRGRMDELYPWRPDRVRVEVMPDDSIRYHVRERDSGPEKIFLQGEVLHLRGLSLDGPLGLSPIDQAREALGEAFSAQAYASSFFENDARPSIWLKHPAHFKDESVRRDWLSQFKRQFGKAGRFSPMITEYGIEINSLPPVNHSDLQFIELRKLKNAEICAIYRVPPHKVAILDRATHSNIEHQGIEYVTDCLLTWCRRWEERLAADLLSESERDEFYFEFQLDALMRGDTPSRFDAYSKGISAGWLVRNEVRRRENLDHLPGLDDPLEPVNMVPAGSQPTGPAGGAAKPPADDGADPTDDAQASRAQSLELQARRRVLNRETRALTTEWERSRDNVTAFSQGVTDFYARHRNFVSEALVIPRAEAAAYCIAQCDAIAIAMGEHKVPELLKAWEQQAAVLEFSPLPKPRKE